MSGHYYFLGIQAKPHGLGPKADGILLGQPGCDIPELLQVTKFLLNERFQETTYECENSIPGYII